MPKLNMFRKLGGSSIFIGVKEVKDTKHAEALIKAGLATLFEEKKEKPEEIKEETKDEIKEETKEEKEEIKEEKKPKKNKHKK